MTPSPRILLAAGLLTAGLALTADAHASYSVAVKQRTLVITGDAASDKLALRARPRKLEVDVRDDGTADFRVARKRFDRILVRARDGNDKVRIDESRIVFTKRTPTTLDGGRGADTLVGGRGAEQLNAGDGNDVVDGRRGNDTGRLGPGDDRFSWDPGDGNDTIEGSAGTDALAFDGSRADEAFRISPNQLRARLVRDVGGVVMNLGTLEQIDVRALGGADTLTTDELAGTTLQAVTGNLGDADGATDRVVANATGFDDTIDVAGADGGATVLGLTTPLTLAGAEAGRDLLLVNALAGLDRVSSSGLQATTLALTADGGPDDDTLAGGPAAETFLAGDGSDAVDGNQGNDRAFLGAGDDLFTWDPGDGSDTVEGEAGLDTMIFNGSGANERFDVSANGPRARFTRDVGNITMDLDDVERIDSAALGGADAFTAGDLSGTDLTALRIGLGTDGAADQVVVNASNRADAVTASGVAGNAALTGLPNGLMLAVAGAQVADDRLTINGLAGGDTVDAAALAADAVRLTIDGGADADTLRGARGADVLLGGDGNDDVDGNQGDDLALLGAGDDRFTWDPGDGSDTLEGQDGGDTMAFNGSAGSEVFDVSANGGRVLYTRNVANIVMDLDDVERIDTAALGGADSFTANDVSGTDLTALNVQLGNDGTADDVIARGSNGDDVALVTGSAGNATLTGLSGVALAVTGAQVPADRLSVSLLAGDDVVDASGLAADGIAFRGEGGGGADVLIGSAGADVLRGDAGDDVLVGGPANDDLDGGAGNNTVIQD
jgi:Ca2+-binding RTX toxin-like protein